MPHGNDQNIFIQQRDVASKVSVCRAETKKLRRILHRRDGCCLFGRPRHIGLLLLQVTGGCPGPLPPSTGVLEDFQDADQEADIVIAWLDVGRDRE